MDPRALIGQQIGHIKIVDLIGKGGMGAVYVGVDETLHRRVALKAIRSEHRLNPEAKARFLREARILSQLDHPNICRVHDYIEGSDNDFLVLELVDGMNLRQALKTGLREEQKLQIARQLLEVLVAVHAKGVVHRDLKPENVMIGPGDQVKVLDFGLARSIDEELPVAAPARRSAAPSEHDTAILDGETQAFAGPTVGIAETPPRPSSGNGRTGSADSSTYLMTSAGTVLGTAGYMSPEQARGETITAASDMYALGLILQEMFSGQAAFDRKLDRHALIQAAARGETRPVRGLSPELGALVERLKATEPARRPSSLDAAERLQWILDGPRRRRRRVVIAAAWLVLAVFATIMALQAYRLAQARQRELLASRFGAEVQQIESLMRFAHLAPLHDLSADRERVRERIGWVRDHMRDVGDWGIGPGCYAMGRGYLALDEPGPARVELERAWDEGHTTPEVAFALGLALGELYQQGLDRLRTIDDPTQREQERQRIEHELRDPALERLRASTGVETEAPELVEGLIALLEQRWDDAIASAARCDRVGAWYYEGRLLEGRARILMARQRQERGHGTEALEDYDLADTALGRAIAVGSSDPRAHAARCLLWTEVMRSRLYDIGGDLEGAMDRALTACDQTLVARPEHLGALRLETICHRMLAEARIHSDPEAAMQALRDSTATATRMVEIDPDDANAHHMLGNAQVIAGLVAIQNGGDGTADTRAGAASLARAVALEPSHKGRFLDLGNAHHFLAQALDARGEDPEADLDLAEEAFRKAIALDPAFAPAYNNLSDLAMTRARIAREHGGDPLPHVAEAIRSAEQALEHKPDHMFAHANMANACLMEAEVVLASGGDPSAALATARAATRKALELRSDYPPTRLYLARAALVEARFLTVKGDDPAPAIEAGLDAVRETLEIAPGWPEAVAVRDQLREAAAAGRK